MIAGGFVLVVIILITVIFLGRGPGGSKSVSKVNLKFWGVFDSESDLKSSIEAFRHLNRGVTISYRQFNFEDYEKQLVDAFASGNGPDIWMMHNTWLPKHKDKIYPLPQKIIGQKEPLFTLRSFREQFVEVAEKDLVRGEDIYALPLYVDSLALYYNKDIFNSLGIARPPATWEEFNQIVQKITLLDANNNISRAGAAIGTAKNINRSTDILGLIMMQSGVPMADPISGLVAFVRSIDDQDKGVRALTFYTDFANPAKVVYTWNDTLHYSIDAFQEGTAAMMFNYAHQIPVLRAKAPRLNFAVAPMPQLQADSVVNYANYWAPTVSKFSPDKEKAWQFLVYLSSTEGVIPFLNSTSHPTARRDLVDPQKDDLDLGVFARQALSAQSWYQVDNLAIDSIMADAIDGVNFKRQSPKEALDSAQNKINLLSRKNR